MSVTGSPGGEPVKAGLPLTDLAAGLFATIGILGALHHRTHSGRGQHIDTSLVDAGLALSVWEVTDYITTGNVPGPIGSAHRLTAPYQAFKCADGHITIGAANDRNFVKVTTTLGHPEWASDPRFMTNHLRVQHRIELAAAIEEVTKTAPRGGLARAPRCGRHSVRADPELRRRADHTAGRRPGDDDGSGPSNPRAACERWARRSRCRRRRSTPIAAPQCSASILTSVLAAAGYSSDEIEQLRYAGAVL